MENSPAKAQRLEARVSPEQKATFQRAAQLLGRSLTDFMIDSLQQAAQRVIKENEILMLNEVDQQQFIDTLLNPPQPNEKLRIAMQRYKEAIK